MDEGGEQEVLLLPEELFIVDGCLKESVNFL